MKDYIRKMFRAIEVPTLESFIFSRKLHADMNASRNPLSRAKWGMHLLSVKKAFGIGMSRFFENLNSKRYKCLWGKARGLLTENKYFSHSPKLEVGIIVHTEGYSILSYQ